MQAVLGNDEETGATSRGAKAQKGKKMSGDFAMATERSITVRGYKFALTGGYIPLAELSKLYLVIRAIDGDELAAELLNAAGTTVKDFDRKQIWPMVGEAKK